ncbi:MAG: carboxy terminal-processing peptidase [Gammaproteobacteria bacterium]|nr:carboxy terminal-processing peptidase [Gammaproteobacteria bacterium]
MTVITMFSAQNVQTAVRGFEQDTAHLHPAEHHRDVSRLVARLIEHSHYRKQSIDDTLSINVFNKYLDTLDPNRLYFNQADIAELSKRFQLKLDDAVRRGELSPVFAIFQRYQERIEQRVDYAVDLLKTEMNLEGDEFYRFDRRGLPWPADEQAADTLWRQRVTNDAIGLILTDKSWGDTADVLTKRYQRLARRTNQLTSDEIFELFMNTFTDAFDPHSNYFSPQNQEEYRIQMSLAYEGIGASLRMEEDYVKIADVLPGGPAAIDGSLRAEDRITAVAQGQHDDMSLVTPKSDDEEIADVIGWRLEDVVKLIRGPRGTTVSLRILPAGAAPGDEETWVSLVRNEVKLEARRAQKEIIDIQRDSKRSRIGVITVPSFYQDFQAARAGDDNFTSTTADVRRLINELKAEDIDGLLVDLRNNGGGHLSEATEMTGLFVDQGPIVQLKHASGRIGVESDPQPGLAYTGPLAVLVNRHSASASEIFAAAIQDYNRGIVIGQQTFGKGTVQSLYDLNRYADDDEQFGQLTLTIGKYYRVTGGSTQHRGVIPDISLPSVIDPNLIGEDTEDTALPWDQIDATEFKRQRGINTDIDFLTNLHKNRATGDPDFEFLIKTIADYEEERAKNDVSLNLTERRLERERLRQLRLDTENLRRTKLGLSELETLEDVELLELSDVTLDAAAEIVVDLAKQLGQPKLSNRR